MQRAGKTPCYCGSGRERQRSHGGRRGDERGKGGEREKKREQKEMATETWESGGESKEEEARK